MTNREYWVKRALLRENESYLKGAALSAKIFKEYEAAAKEIRGKIDIFYSKYSRKYGLTYEQAVRLLNKHEMQEWKANLGEYVKRIAEIKDPRIKALLTSELDALSVNSSITRLEALLGQIDMILNDLFDKGVSQMQEEFGDAFIEGYYKKSYDLQSRAGFFNEIAKIDVKAVEDIISYPWSGAMFSDRLWRNKQALIFNSKEIITQGIIQGKSISEMSSSLSAKMGQSYKNAERLIRTETARIHSESDLAAYKEAGVEEYEFMATLEYRTCEICRSLDGKHFKLSEAQEGINYPLMHPGCRCTTVEYDPDDAMDWYNSGHPMPKRMTYKEWYDKQTALHGHGYVETQRKKLYNETADKKQYDNYRNILGSNAPSSFEAFQNIKYSRTSEYNHLKSYVRGIKSGELSSFADFTLYKQTSAEIDKQLVGIVTSQGISITSKSDHFINRLIGSAGQRRSGVTIDAVKETLICPEKTDIRKSSKGTSVRYFGKDVIVTVNPDTGKLIQANPRHRKKGIS